MKKLFVIMISVLLLLGSFACAEAKPAASQAQPTAEITDVPKTPADRGAHGRTDPGTDGSAHTGADGGADADAGTDQGSEPSDGCADV